MKIYGLIGNPLTHSLSPKYFNDKFQRDGLHDHRYEAFKLEDIDEFPQLLNEKPELAGLNVTIPFKETVIKYINRIDRDARLIGAVNTIKFIRQKDALSLQGYNTDVFGIEASLEPYLKMKNMQALILGTGGTARAVTFVLKKYGISYQHVTRRPLKSNHIVYWSVSKSVLNEHKLIINTTPWACILEYRIFPILNTNS
ncbi:MAG: shikimate dehydrogenase [Bacteroidota bacterium]|nr:shikimate dehydrogenase [Bacteroidota bacterium]